MNTFNRIIATISKYNDDNHGQVNLGSPHARADLAELIYKAVMKQDEITSSHTINKQDTFIFENNNSNGPK